MNVLFWHRQNAATSLFLQVRTMTPGQVRPQTTLRTTTPMQMKQPLTTIRLQGAKPTVPSALSKPATKDKDKKSFVCVHG